MENGGLFSKGGDLHGGNHERRFAGLPASGIRRFTALAKAEPGCLFLTIGEPDFSTPEPIKEATKTALDQNLTHYPPERGGCIAGENLPV